MWFIVNEGGLNPVFTCQVNSVYTYLLSKAPISLIEWTVYAHKWCLYVWRLLWTSVRVLRKFNRKYPWYLFISFGKPFLQSISITIQWINVRYEACVFKVDYKYGRPSGYFNQYPQFMSVSAASYTLPSYRWSSSRPQNRIHYLNLPNTIVPG